MKTEKELKEIAFGINSGTIISSMTLQDRDLATVFMPLSFMNENQYKEFLDKKPGLIFEYLDQSLPLCSNGFPMFSSMKILNVDEFHKLVDIIKELKDWLENEKKI